MRAIALAPGDRSTTMKSSLCLEAAAGGGSCHQCLLALPWGRSPLAGSLPHTPSTPIRPPPKLMHVQQNSLGLQQAAVLAESAQHVDRAQLVDFGFGQFAVMLKELVAARQQLCLEGWE